MKPTALLNTLLLTLTLSSAQAGTPSISAKSSKNPVVPQEAVNWKDNTISPVADILEFEDPVIRTEIRPAFIYHNIDGDFVTQGGHATLLGAQVRFAVNDRLALIVNKGGYLDIDPGVGPDLGGWANLTGGFKYALVDDMANAFILTAGLTYTAPTGDETIFHGTGDGLINGFTSFEKGWGNFHLMGTLGYSQALDTGANSSIFHYGLHADYYTCQWFIPFVSAVGWTVADAGGAIPLDTEGYDTINFGSSNSDGVTQIVLGAGFRTRFTKNLDFGVAYQKAVVSPEGLFDDRFTFDFAIRF